MADWSALTRGFQEGADWRQRFRANKQYEAARDQALEQGEYGLQAARDFRRAVNPDAAGELGADYAAGNTNWTGQLQDPFAYKLMDWFKSKMKKKGAKAVSSGEGSITPTDAVAQQGGGTETYALNQEELPEGEAFADGGEVSEEEKIRRAAQRNRQNIRGEVRNATETVKGADRTVKAPRKAIDAGEFMGRAKPTDGVLKRAAKGAGRLGAATALGATALDAASTDTEDYRKRFGMETNDPSFFGDVGVRALGAASDLGNNLTMGMAGRFFRDKQEQTAPPQQALAEGDTEAMSAQEQMPDIQMSAVSRGGGARRSAIGGQAAPETVDFSDLDIDAKDVPNMQTDDWKKYRAQMIAAAQKSGDPSAVGKVNDMVTQMQHQGFMNYGQQGLALQQAGNVRGAMAAYRAAFQYFPNGNDVEFGTHVDKRTGRKQIVGFGMDEKTGKVVPGTELVMDPERVAVLLENFKNPQAFRMWTKDWRDFEQERRKYEEVQKPLAQAQADALATNSDANVLRAENAALRAGGAGGAGMRNAENVFRQRLQMLGLEDEPQADFLASVMSQVKARNPQVPDNTIVQVIMQAQRDGTLQKRLQKMGIGVGQPSARSAIPATRVPPPIPGATGDVEMEPDTTANPMLNRRALADINQQY